MRIPLVRSGVSKVAIPITARQNVRTPAVSTGLATIPREEENPTPSESNTDQFN